jgi:hypothetical protein
MVELRKMLLFWFVLLVTLDHEESARVLGVCEEVLGEGFVSLVIIIKGLIKEGSIVNG